MNRRGFFSRILGAGAAVGAAVVAKQVEALPIAPVVPEVVPPPPVAPVIFSSVADDDDDDFYEVTTDDWQPNEYGLSFEVNSTSLTWTSGPWLSTSPFVVNAIGSTSPRVQPIFYFSTNPTSV